LKTALLHLVQNKDSLDASFVVEAAASFQQAIVDVLVTKTLQAGERLGVRQVLLGGGVAANKALGDHFVRNSPIPVLIPPPSLCTDNAAMIAACGYYRFQLGVTDGYDIDVVPGLSLG
jgi:N6-L-threonylcarbamoyladenine synthase